MRVGADRGCGVGARRRPSAPTAAAASRRPSAPVGADRGCGVGAPLAARAQEQESGHLPSGVSWTCPSCAPIHHKPSPGAGSGVQGLPLLLLTKEPCSKPIAYLTEGSRGFESRPGFPPGNSVGRVPPSNQGLLHFLRVGKCSETRPTVCAPGHHTPSPVAGSGVQGVGRPRATRKRTAINPAKANQPITNPLVGLEGIPVRQASRDNYDFNFINQTSVLVDTSGDQPREIHSAHTSNADISPAQYLGVI